MYFNPLASERRDYLQTIRRSDVDGISIHSPLRGETYTRGQVGDETSKYPEEEKEIRFRK